MSAPHKLSATALTTLSCSLLIAAGCASSAAAGPTAAPRAAIACAKSSSASRLDRRRAHACRAHAPAPPAAKPAKPRPARQTGTHATHRRTAAQPPAAPPAPAVASEASGAPAAQSSTAAHAAAIAAVLATPCQNTELTPEAGNIALVRAAVLCLINHKRAENDESPLQTSPQLEQAAAGHCEELIADDYFAHVSPSGETPVQRIRDTGYIPNANVGYVIGENLAWGTYQLSTPQAIVAAWIASPGHLANILESQYTETGIGVTPAVPASLGGDAPGATYAQEFGVIIQ